MTRLIRTAFALMLGLGSAVGSTVTPTVAADLSVYVEDSGVCGEPSVLRKITSRFRHQVRHVPNLPQVEITDFRMIHQHRYLPALGEERPIARRYCGATVDLSHGGSRDIWYLIESGQGFASIGDNVEFCVSGFDRWFVYNGRCRVLR